MKTPRPANTYISHAVFAPIDPVIVTDVLGAAEAIPAGTEFTFETRGRVVKGLFVDDRSVEPVDVVTTLTSTRSGLTISTEATVGWHPLEGIDEALARYLQKHNFYFTGHSKSELTDLTGKLQRYLKALAKQQANGGKQPREVAERVNLLEVGSKSTNHLLTALHFEISGEKRKLRRKHRNALPEGKNPNTFGHIQGRDIAVEVSNYPSEFQEFVSPNGRRTSSTEHPTWRSEVRVPDPLVPAVFMPAKVGVRPPNIGQAMREVLLTRHSGSAHGYLLPKQL